MKIRLLLPLLAVLALVGCAAQPTRMATPMSLPAANGAIIAASGGLAHAVRVFAGPGDLTGAVVRNHDGTENVAWVAPGGQAVIIDGTLVGPKGQDLTRQALYAQGLLLYPAAALARVAQPASDAILLGSNPNAPVVTAFFDPNCYYCHAFFEAMYPQVEQGKVRLRLVLVGVIKPDSLPRAASILEAQHRRAALIEDETHFDIPKEEGGYPIDGLLDPGLEQVVRANGVVMARAGGQGTPTLLYCDARTHSVRLLPGVPGNVPAFVGNLSTGPAAACH